MIALELRLDGDGALAEEAAKADRVEHLKGDLIVMGLAAGMTSGAPSVALGFTLDDGKTLVVAETSLKLFLTAADALKARYGDPR